MKYKSLLVALPVLALALFLAFCSKEQAAVQQSPVKNQTNVVHERGGTFTFLTKGPSAYLCGTEAGYDVYCDNCNTSEYAGQNTGGMEFGQNTHQNGYLVPNASNTGCVTNTSNVPFVVACIDGAGNIIAKYQLQPGECRQFYYDPTTMTLTW